MAKFSIEWIYRECMMHNHAIGVTLKKPITKEGINYHNVTIVSMIVSDKIAELLTANIMNGINTNKGVISCMGYIGNCVIHHEQKKYNINVEDIEEIECISN